MGTDRTPTQPPAIGLPLYVHQFGGMKRDDLRGEWVKLSDARYAMNAMQSVIASTECAGLPQSHALVKHHKERGDMLRIWEIIGDANAGGGMRQDVFQRLTEIMETLHRQRAEITWLREQAHWVEILKTSNETPPLLPAPEPGWDDP